MDVLIVLVFISIVLVAGGILLLLVSLHQRDFEHAERLALLPLLDSDGSPGAREGAAPRLGLPESATETDPH